MTNNNQMKYISAYTDNESFNTYIDYFLELLSEDIKSFFKLEPFSQGLFELTVEFTDDRSVLIVSREKKALTLQLYSRDKNDVLIETEGYSAKYPIGDGGQIDLSDLDEKTFMLFGGCIVLFDWILRSPAINGISDLGAGMSITVKNYGSVNSTMISIDE